MDANEKKVLKRKLQKDLLFFFRYFFKKRYGYKANIAAHHIKICKTLQKLANGKIRRLIINIPPRYGKTDIAVISFMAWAIANNPQAKFIHLSYSDDLALDNSSQVKEIIEMEEFKELFDVDIRKDTRSKKKWYTTKKGGVYATSAGGQVTGFGAGTSQVDNLPEEMFADSGNSFSGAIVIDDPLKPDDAHSDTTRTKINLRYNNTISSRVNSRNTPIIVIMQRIHEEDMSGYLLGGGSGEKWTHLNIPAQDKHGDAIWPFKHTTEELETIKKGSSYTYAGQYMQEPSPTGGGIFKDEWFRWWVNLPKIKYKFITMDTAQKTKEWNDFTVMQCWGVCEKGDLYLLDMLRGKFEAPELRKKARSFIDKHKHKTIHEVRFRHAYIEDKSSGSSLIQDLKLEGFPIRGIQRNADKVSRSHDTSPYIEQGRVYLNKNVPGIEDLESEARGFPNAKHDDTLDPMMDAIDICFIGSGSSAVAAMMA